MIQGNTQNEVILETSLRVLWRVYVGMHSLIKTTWQTFRQGKSCLSNLLELFEDITATRDKGKSVLVVYFNAEVSASRMSVHAVAWQERLVSSRTLNPGPLGSGVGITMFLLIFCAKCHLCCCVHWRGCVGSDPSWSGTAEVVESACGYLWERRVPVEATCSGIWGQGERGTVALCLLHSWCLLPIPARSWVLVPPPGPACGCQSGLGKGPGNPTPPGMCVLGEQSISKPTTKWGRMDGCGNYLCCRWRSWLCIAGVLWPAVAVQEPPWDPGVRPMVIPSYQLPCVQCSQPGKSPVPCKTRNGANKQCKHTGVYINFYPGVCVIYIWFNHT